MSWFRGYGAEVELKESTDFLKIMETLTRMGYPDDDRMEFVQSCHILHKKGRYAIMHHNEMYALDGDRTRLTPDDVEERNVVVQLLAKWGLVKPLAVNESDKPIELGALRVLQWDDKYDAKRNPNGKWTAVPRYVMRYRDGR